jgi:hypothetical protein
MTINTNTKFLDKKQIIIWISAIILTIITAFLIFWFVLDDKSINGNPNQKDKLTEKGNETNKFSTSKNPAITLNELAGDFSGIRESMDGSIEAVFLQISEIDYPNSSFSLILNIGVNKKFTGTGIFVPDSKMIKSDIIGNLMCSINENDKIILLSPIDKSNSKYKLIKE